MPTLNENIHQAIEDFDNIKSAIIEKGVAVPIGTSTSDYGEKIKEIETGITPTGTIDITENETDIDVARYAKANVNVPPGGGITVNESYDISDGTLNKGNITLVGDIIANIPDGVTTISAGAFTNNQNITSVIIPDGVTTIEDGKTWEDTERGAFYGCTGLTSITIPDNVTSIDEETFTLCTGLTSITIPDSVTTIGRAAFYGCTGLTAIDIPDSVTRIGNYVFNGCTGLTSITIHDSVTTIGNGAFIGCTGLTSITIPDSVTSIDGQTFYGCTGLTSIVIPDSVASIGEETFSNCSSLTDIYYTGTQAEWEQITICRDAIPDGTTIHYGYTPN